MSKRKWSMPMHPGGIVEYEYDDEPDIEIIINTFLSFRRRDDELILTREYIIGYIQEHKSYDNLRAAIRDVCIEFESTLDKLILLR
jgi:hypothetical protein